MCLRLDYAFKLIPSAFEVKIFIVWTIISFFLGNTNHIILFLYILVIICANLTSNAVLFKRLLKELRMYTSLLIDFCNDYRPHLC